MFCYILCIKSLKAVSTNISIIIPAFNSERFIKECITNILNKINKKIELIIINDNSNDNTKKICNRFVRKNNSIKLINLKKNCGVSVARNIGIRESKGKYLIFLDSDDLLVKDTLNKINKLIDKSDNKDIIFFPSYDPINKIIDNNSLIKKSSNKSFINNIKNFSEFRLTCWNFIYKKNFLKERNIQFSNIRIFEEQTFLTKAIIEAKTFQIFKIPLYQRRIIEVNSLSANVGYDVMISCIKNLYTLIKFYQKKRGAFNKIEKLFLDSRFTFLMGEIYKNVILLKKKQINEITKIISKKYNFKKNKIYTNTDLKELFKDQKALNKTLLRKNNIEKNKIFKILNKISNEEIIVYCAGSYSKIILKLIPIYNIKIKFVCDSNLGFQNQKIYKHKIKSKKYLVKSLKKFSDNNILISNFSIKTSINIKNDLVRSGFNKNKIYCLGY